MLTIQNVWRQKTARKFAFESEKMLGENDTKIKSHGESFQKNVASGISKEILLYWKKIQKVSLHDCIYSYL